MDTQIVRHLFGVLFPPLPLTAGVDIKEGFWHTFICPTFNRKLKFKKNIFHFQLLLAESTNLTKSSSDNAQISGLMISKFFTVNF